MRYVKLMLRTCSGVIALNAMVAGLSMSAQAAEPATQTLACKGTATDATKEDAKPTSISMGIIVNFTAGTVTGFTYPRADLLVKITGFDEVHIVFGGSNGNRTINGSIDRVTGDVAATSTITYPTTISETSYDLKCKPTQRMF